MNMKPHQPVIIAIVLAAALIAAVGYFARQLASRPDEARVLALIEDRLNAQQKQEQPALQANALTEKGILAMIDKRLAQQKSTELSDKDFNARVERGIVAFIDKQRREEQERPNRLARNVPPPAKDDHVYGNATAPITLIEYSDFECPYCKRFHDTAKQLVDRSDGKVDLVYRHFPLDFHNPGAEKEAEASECVAQLGGNVAFWKFADAVYTRTRSNGKGFPVDNLAPLAVELGLDKDAFQKCLDSGRMAARVRHDLDTGTKAGVQGTPGNILRNNRTGEVIAVHGAQPYERLSEAAQKLLKAQ
jgi:protein-disulfide isomerase